MLYQILAQLVVALHFIFILYAIFGAVLAWPFPRTLWLHVPVFLWAGAIMLTGAICPLTPLEITLRERAGMEGYDTGFIEHYLLPIIYPGALTREIQIGLGAAVLTWNGLLYAGLIRRWRTSRQRARETD